MKFTRVRTMVLVCVLATLLASINLQAPIGLRSTVVVSVTVTVTVRPVSRWFWMLGWVHSSGKCANAHTHFSASSRWPTYERDAITWATQYNYYIMRAHMRGQETLLVCMLQHVDCMRAPFAKNMRTVRLGTTTWNLCTGVSFNFVCECTPQSRFACVGSHMRPVIIPARATRRAHVPRVMNVTYT